MNDFEIIRVDENHLADYHGLMAVFAEAFDDQDNYVKKVPGEDYLRALLRDQSFFLLVARHEGEVIAGLTAYELRKFERETSEIYIYDLAVSPLYRKQGVATALIERMRGYAQEVGAWVVCIQADKGDTPAVKLYSKLGTYEEVLHFDIAVA